MNRVLVPFADTKQFSSLVDDYFSNNENLKPYFRFTPEIDSFQSVIDQRKQHSVNRIVLHDRLISQYGTMISPDHGVAKNILLLKSENTFTVTTGHQLNIFTGPLYFIYKIATTVKLAESLKEKHSEYNFIPVFWMASEDHDFDEIRKVTIFGKEVEWTSKLKGAVGKYTLEGLDIVIDEINAISGNRSNLHEIFKDAYLHSNTLAEATRKIVHALFGSYGLVIIDGDDAGLKSLFKDVMLTEITRQLSFQSVAETNTTFSKHYKVQVTPREINLFYMMEGLRERIVPENDGSFSVVNTNKVFSSTSILEELENHPERFSPNVVMRPIYQEKILPNLAYIGGPGELNYWLQLLKTFDAYKVSFPILVLRNCMLIINASVQKKMMKVGIEVDAVFQSVEYLTLEVLERAASLHIGTEMQAARVQKMMDELAAIYNQLDPTLTSSVDAEKQKMLNGLRNIEDKARRALKKKNETLVLQVKGIKELLMPNGKLQERTENILSVSDGDVIGFIKEIIHHTDPFVKQFIVLKE